MLPCVTLCSLSPKTVKNQALKKSFICLALKVDLCFDGCLVHRKNFARGPKLTLRTTTIQPYNKFAGKRKNSISTQF